MNVCERGRRRDSEREREFLVYMRFHVVLR